MRVLALASQKGGSGKTTLSGHLAVQAQRAGAGPVVLIDIDPQGSLADWWNEREAEYPAFAQTTVARLASDLQVALLRADVLHLDTGAALGGLGGGGGAFAVANLGPDASNLPVRMLVETLETPNLDQQVAALEQKTLKLYRNDITRGTDTAESLLRRLGLVDSVAAAYIRKTQVCLGRKRSTTPRSPWCGLYG